eukprot:CAMPEP_0178390938 /NCGR_PEP_ID=MMETSP0689_2-20121128/10904_1 /TAXON_ID=160604 /ORGANISM="Amphidinium massartii, Strain CS-259" /LENGTH=307 /DNA_ID=CAMNT_0020011463 /DNA_START=8 /DNA_END=928 /DNA_ORIENTATION=+
MSLADQAKEHMAQAEKALKPSWTSLKFNPDYLLASMEYGQAASKFRSANMLDDSIKAWVKSSDLKEQQLHDPFGAARGYESAGSICEGRPNGAEEATALWTKAVLNYRLAGKPEPAAKMTLKLAAMHQKKGEVDRAKQAYEDALEIYQGDGKDYELRELYRTYIGFLITSKLFPAAFAAIDENIQLLIRQNALAFAYKEMLCKVVIHLHLDDVVAAEEALGFGSEPVDGWFLSPECQAGMNLIEAFKAYDGDAVKKQVKDQVFTFLPVEVARLAVTLKVNTGYAPPPATVAATPGGGGDAITPAAEP